VAVITKELLHLTDTYVIDVARTAPTPWGR
jgi:uncharacterized protein YxjI